jgi:hypothetical protein
MGRRFAVNRRPSFYFGASNRRDGDEPMIDAAHNTTQDCDLAAIVARGVARYQASLPEDFRQTPQFYGEPVTDEEAAVEFNVSRVTEERQRELCLSCALSDCVGIENATCPIRAEARRLWRARKEKQND